MSIIQTILSLCAIFIAVSLSITEAEKVYEYNEVNFVEYSTADEVYLYFLSYTLHLPPF
jgi:hypothetical protein